MFRKFLAAGSTLLFFGAAVILLVYNWVTERFETATLDNILLYLSLPLTGVDIRYITSLACQLAAAAALASVFGILAFRSLSRPRVLRVSGKLIYSGLTFAAAAAFAFGVLLLEKKFKLRRTFFPDMTYYSFFEENYVLPDFEAADFREKRNLVIVIVESLDKAVNNEQYFGEALMPRLRDRESSAASFSGHRQTVGTEYSIVSLYSVLMGFPCIFKPMRVFFADEDQENRLHKPTRDLSEFSILGFLEKNGYSIDFFCGADGSFAGFEGLLRQAAANIRLHDFPQFGTEKENFWGINDSTLYSLAKESLSAGRDEPFAIIVQTVNTHSPGAAEDTLPRPFSDYRDTFVQADILLDDFLEWLKQQEFYEKTSVIVYGDHIPGTRKFGSVQVPFEDDPGVSVLFLNVPESISGTVQPRRLFTTWDLAPTILESAGAVLPRSRFGHGTSLFSSEKNLLEMYGEKYYTTMIQKRSKMYEEVFELR